MADNAVNKTNTESLADEILGFSRDSLLVNLRFLDSALNRLGFQSYSGTYATDGYRLFYDPRHVLKTYRAEQTLPARNCLHVILHCVFQHICIPDDAYSDTKKRRLWDISCDIASEYTISVLGLQMLACRDQNRQERVFSSLLSNIDILTCEKLYRYFIKAEPDEEELSAYETLFHVDEHDRWRLSAPPLNDIWQGVSRRMQVDMETFTRQSTGGAGALMQNLKETNREVSDYAAFLRKFATRGDGMKLDPDEFDYTLYSYGMQISGGKIPLIEQTEYRDPMRVRDVAIAIFAHDILTQEKIRLFLINTWDILHSTESFSSKARLHVLLPSKSDIPGEDASYVGVLKTIETHVIESTEQMLEFVSGLTVPDAHGYDFRPVFDRVSYLNRIHRFKNLRGVLILTEDVGVFPSVMPAFPGAFIFVNNDYSVPDVPPWAIRLVLQSDEI